MDKLSIQRRSENMRKIRCKDTKPEVAVRKLIYHMGFRYRLGGYGLPGKPDIIFPGRNKVIYVHGCFWHQHSATTCKEKHVPKSNVKYWLPKLKNNRLRFDQNIRKLKSAGWKYMVIWECQLKNTEKIVKNIQAYLE